MHDVAPQAPKGPLFVEEAASLCLGDEPVKSQVRKLSTTHGFLCSFTLKGCRGKSEMFPMLAGNWLPNYLDVFLTLLSWWSTACGCSCSPGTRAASRLFSLVQGTAMATGSGLLPFGQMRHPLPQFKTFLRLEKDPMLNQCDQLRSRAVIGSEEQVGFPKSMAHNVSVAICVTLFFFFCICQKKKCKCCIQMLICSINK